jgi:diguanylate cyclase (GGDEF)-like protein/PAS domain S-box-containing protein
MLKAVAPGADKPCILLVDDQQANLLSYEVLLEEFDAQLLRATSGNEALQLLLRHEVALVVLDVQMPGMDGFEVAQIMQKARHSQNIPIIFVTAINQDPRNVLKAYQSGAADFISKPVEPVAMKSKVQVFLELYVKSRELEASNRALQASLRELERLKEHNELLLFSVGDGIVSVDVEGRVQYANPAAMALLDEGDSLLGSLLSDHFADDRGAAAVAEMLARCADGERWHITGAARRQGQIFPAEFTATAILRDNGQFEGVSIVIKDVTDRHKLEQKLKAESERDPLTGLVNRRGFERLFKQRLSEGAAGMALLYVDLDYFKPVNDRYGHQAGDSVLKFIAQRMISCTRAEDIVARIGGDEFCIVIQADDIEVVAGRVGRKLVDLAAQPLRLGHDRVQIGASVGIVLADPAHSLADIMHQADVAMYAAKGRGRGNLCFYEPGQEGRGIVSGR